MVRFRMRPPVLQADLNDSTYMFMCQRRLGDDACLLQLPARKGGTCYCGAYDDNRAMSYVTHQKTNMSSSRSAPVKMASVSQYTCCRQQMHSACFYCPSSTMFSNPSVRPFEHASEGTALET